MPIATSDALTKLAAKNVIILGGTSAVSASVQATLSAKYTVTRVAGSNRYATAKAIAATAGVTVGTIGGVKTAVLASGATFADALTAGPLGYAKQFPITITDPAVLSADTKATFSNLGIKNVIIAGGTAAVSAAVEAEVKALGITTTRLAGNTRQLTAVAIADFETANGFGSAHVNLARGDDFADALAGGPHAGKELAPILLTDTPTALGAAATAYLTTHSNTLTSGNIFGGTSAVSDAVKTAGETAAKGTQAASRTTLPELSGAAITGTVTAGQSNGTNTPGTTVAYTFDEPIAAVANVALFKLYDNNDNAVPATSVVSVVGNVVTVRFNTINGTTDSNGSTTPAAPFVINGGPANNVNNYTLATVASVAVTDNQGENNPDGASAVGTASTTAAPTATANTTTAPDLRSVSGFRVASATTTAVDFVFDQNAYSVNGAGFFLVLSDGSTRTCTGPLTPTTSGGSGGTLAGGNGTTTLTVVCNNTPAAGASTLVPSATNVVRGYVNTGTVQDAATAAMAASGTLSLNPLESANAANGGLTTDADLLSAQFIPAGTGTNTTPGTSDQVLYTFDQAPTAPTVAGANANFRVFRADGTERPSVSVQSVSVDGKQVLVNFAVAATGDLKNAVGASVNTGAVSNNEPASVGVTPVQAGSSSITPGQVSAPELTSVTLNKSTDAFGATTFSATYTFDKAVGTANITAANSAKFHLYDADGFAFNGLNCAPVSTTSASNAAVTCTSYTPVGTATASQTVANTTLGTVDATAVTGTIAPNMGMNPEGAAPATGGTGTPLAG